MAKAVTSLFDDPQGIDWWNLQEPSSALHALAKQAGYMGNLFDQTTTTDDLGHNQTMRTPNAAAIEALKGYTAGEQYRSGNSAMRDITGPNGQSAGSQSFGDMSRGGLAEQLTPLVMAGMTGAGLYGAFGGAGGLGGFGGAGGEAASLGAGVTSGAADSIGAYLAANPVNMASLTAGIPEISAITAAAGGAAAGAAIPTLTSGAAESLAAYSAANPVTVAQLGAGIPDIASITAAGASAASLQSIRAAEHANMGQAAGNIPKTVNMGGLGGTTATAGGLQGLLDVGSQGLADATASSQIGGTAASQLGQAANSGIGSIASGAGDVAGFMKSNPMLGKLLFSGALGALASSGGVSSAGAPKTYGAPVQWNSPLRSNGLLGGQQAPQAQQSMPGGLLGTGQANDGAWRWMKG